MANPAVPGHHAGMASPDPAPGPRPVPSTPLDLVIEMTTAFARAADAETTLRLGLARAVERLEAEAGSLFLIDPADGALVCRASVGPVDVTGLRLAPGVGIVGRTVAEGRPIRVDDTGAAAGFAPGIDAATGFVTRSILCAPIAVGAERLGAIELFNKVTGRGFGEAETRLLEALAAAAGLALVNARLLAGLAEQESLRRDLALAAEIQQAMLPGRQPPDSPIHAAGLAARGVSGDFYEIVPLAGGRIAFAVGDVSGKGINAALLMARSASLFRCLARREAGPGAVLAAIDAELAGTLQGGMFVTMVAGLFDPASGRVRLANAGHEPPVLLGRPGARVLTEGGPPLGIAPGLFDPSAAETEVDLDFGTLYLFTDGLSEARTPQGAMLGEEGVLRLLGAVAEMPLRDRLDIVFAAVGGGGALRDDVTLMVVADRRGPPSGAVRRRFAARPDRLAEIRALVGGAAAALGADAAAAADCVLAADEACQNIIRHAYHGGEGVVVVGVDRRSEGIVIELMDFAPPVDQSTLVSRPLEAVRPGGLGLHLMRSVMDRVEFVPPPAGIGNLLRLVKRI